MLSRPFFMPVNISFKWIIKLRFWVSVCHIQTLPLCLSLLNYCHVCWWLFAEAQDTVCVTGTVSSCLQETNCKTEPFQLSFIDNSVIFLSYTVYFDRSYMLIFSPPSHSHIHTVTHIHTWELPCGAAQYICSALGWPPGHSTTASSGSVLHSDTPWQ